jgi:hypothetical protein
VKRELRLAAVMMMMMVVMMVITGLLQLERPGAGWGGNCHQERCS